MRVLFLISLLWLNIYCQTNRKQARATPSVQTVTKIEMNLSAFGVESNGFPNIEAVIDFISDTNVCHVSYYDPKFKDSTYCLTQKEVDSLKFFIGNCDLRKLKKEYVVGPTDQPTSTTIIYTPSERFKIKDYGLQGDFPLQELYRIVYKLNVNFR